jgi:hypothetical protein
MVFTFFHALIAFLFWLPLSARLEIFSFFAGSVAPDIEAAYFAVKAYNYCNKNDYACLAEYPSHWFLHSFVGITFLGVIIAFCVRIFRERFGLKNVELKKLFFSALIGGATHLLVDVTVHKGEDALMLLFPLEQRFSFIFPHSFTFWHVIAAIGFIMLIINFKKLKVWMK